MIMYHAQCWSIRPIYKATVDHATRCYVFIDGQRRARLTYGAGYFDTYDEAKNFLMEHQIKTIGNVNDALLLEQARYDKFRKLKP